MHHIELNWVTVYIFNPNHDEVKEFNTTIRIDYDDISERKTAQISLEALKTLSLDNVNDSSLERSKIPVSAEPGIVKQDAFTDDYYVWYAQPNMVKAKEVLYNSIRLNTDWEIAQYEHRINSLKEFIDRAARILT